MKLAMIIMVLAYRNSETSVTVATTLQYPEQIHISYGSTQDSMVVMWSSRDDLQWEVHYDTVPTLMHMSANSTVAKLPDANSKAAKYVYRSELNGLMPATTYFYRIVSKDDRMPLARSPTFSFNTLQDGNDFDTVSRFVVYGDMGANKSDPTRAAIGAFRKSTDIQAVLHVGDIAYDLHGDGGKVGDKFFEEIQSLAAEVPYMTTPGNHEIPLNFEPYRVRFSTPNTSWPIPLNKMWYSFDIGLVHFISYSTEVYFTDGEKYVCEQFHWLTQELIAANQNRDKRPWIIAMGHRPMYCSNSDHDDCTNPFIGRWVKTGLESLFNAQGVDIIIQAHEHSYERLYPLFDGKVERFNYTNPRAPVHVISGAAGSPEGYNLWSSSPKSWSAFRAISKDFFSFQAFGVLEVFNRTHLCFTQHDTSSDAITDKFCVKQEHHGPFVKDVNCSGSLAHDSCICHRPILKFRRVIAILATTGALLLLTGATLLIIFIKRRRTKLSLWVTSLQSVCRTVRSHKTAVYKVDVDCDMERLLDNQ